MVVCPGVERDGTPVSLTTADDLQNLITWEGIQSLHENALR
jgi:hypothetical protein